MHRASATLAALAVAAAAGCGSAPPKLKEGLWEIQGTSLEKPANTRTEFAYKLCRTHAVDEAADAALRNVKGCRTRVERTSRDAYASASNCQVAGVTIVSSGTTTYQKNTSMHAETQATYTPPFNAKAAETMTQDQRYVGKCPDGVKPGDRIFADGIIRHHD